MSLVLSEVIVKKIAMLMASLVLAVPVMAKSTQEISDRPLGERSLFSERAVIERITLAGHVCLEGEPCAAAVVAAPVAGGAPRSGDEVLTAVCAGCHSAGVMGAPVIGNKGQWGSRIAQGKSTLYTHAIGGIRGMPAKGGCGTCSDDEIKAAVDVMIAKAK